jgi:hypothetical protein
LQIRNSLFLSSNRIIGICNSPTQLRVGHCIHGGIELIQTIGKGDCLLFCLLGFLPEIEDRSGSKHSPRWTTYKSKSTSHSDTN